MFESAKLKLERADEHFRDLDKVFTAFLDSRPHRPIYKGQRQDGDQWRVWIEVQVDAPLPEAIPLILGDAIHNYRCAIDHMVWELVVIDGGTPDRYTKLPTGRNRVDFESSARGMKTPRQDTKDFLVDLAVYPTGKGRALYGLNALDNADKHSVITPVLHVSYLDDIVTIDLATGETIDEHPVYSAPVFGERAMAFEAKPGFGIDANKKIQPAPDIFFPEIDVFPNEPVLSTMAQIAQLVHWTIKDAEEFVRLRP